MRVSWVRHGRILGLAILAALLLAPVASAHGAPNRSGGTPVVLTPGESIQAAIQIASPGSTLHLGPGTFVEQLTINKSVTLVGAGSGVTILQSPVVLAPDYLGATHVITVGNGAQVRIEGVTVEVSLTCVAAPFTDGGAVGVGGNASLLLTQSVITTFGDTSQVGTACTVAGVAGLEIIADGVDVGFRSPPLASGTPAGQLNGHAELSHDSFLGFGDASNGPAVSVGDSSGSGSSAILTGDRVLAPPTGLPFFMPDSFHPEVLVANGATATVEHSEILGGSGTFYGLFLFGSGPVLVQHNVIGNITCEGFPPAVEGGFCGPNILVSLQYSGILALAASPATVIKDNVIFDTDSGVYLYFAPGRIAVDSNLILDSLQYAFEVQDSVVTLSHNAVVGAPYEVGVGADVLNSSATLVETFAADVTTGPAVTFAVPGLTATATFLP